MSTNNIDIKKELEALEPYQIKNIYSDEDEPFNNSSNRITNKLILYGIVLFIVTLIASFIVKIPREINLAFELKGGIKEHIIQYSERVYIKKVYVRQGDSVVPGQELIEIGSNNIATFLNTISGKKAEIVFHETDGLLLLDAGQRILNTKIEGAQKQIEKYTAELNTAKKAMDKELEKLYSQIAIQTKQFERKEQLRNSEVISDREFEESKNNLTVLQQNLEKVKADYNLVIARLNTNIQQLDGEANTFLAERRELQVNYTAKQHELEKQYGLLVDKLTTTYGACKLNNNSIVLLSTVAAKVVYISVNEAEVKPEETLLSLLGDKAPYFVYAEALSEQVGKITIGNKAVLKFNSFPFYYYGTMKAVLQSVSQSSNEKGTYPVIAEIKEAGLLNGKIKKGMTGTCSIVVEEKTVADYVLRGLLKVVSIE